jgi:hypothetical protein
LNDKIRDAKRDGLPDAVIQAMDVLRVRGNQSVHEIHFDDTNHTVQALFDLIGIVNAKLITEPQTIAAMYAQLPQSARDAAARRDS